MYMLFNHGATGICMYMCQIIVFNLHGIHAQYMGIDSCNNRAVIKEQNPQHLLQLINELDVRMSDLGCCRFTLFSKQQVSFYC